MATATDPNVQTVTHAPPDPSAIDPNYSPLGTAAQPTNPSALSNFSTSANQFLQTPLGQTATFAVPGAIGMYQAGQAQQRTNQLAGQISALGQPYSQAGAQQLGQLYGGPQAPGPAGVLTAESTGAAQELGQVAQQYGTGNLTPAQNTQVQSYVSQQRAMVDQQLGASGNLNSSARAAAYQQVANNAAMLTQQLIQGNIQMAQGALDSVQKTFSSILNQALGSSEFGLSATSEAVQLQVQSDLQIQQSMNQLMGALAQGLGTAWGGGKGTQGTQGGSAAQQLVNKLRGGGGNVNQPGQPFGTNPPEWSPTDPNNPSAGNPYAQLGANFPGAPLGAPDAGTTLTPVAPVTTAPGAGDFAIDYPTTSYPLDLSADTSTPVDTSGG